jgi:peptidyl-prolyl cis-trans isomerase A (cyclophilin A)
MEDIGGGLALPALGQVSEMRRVRFKTSAGDFHVSLDRALSPRGVDRFLELVEDGFFEDMLLYRVLPGFLVQFGVAADPAMSAKWNNVRLKDEQNRGAFRAGTVSYAGSGAHSRSCHFFVALEPQGAKLGKAMHEAAIGYVDEVEVFEQVVRNFQAAGYPDTGLYSALLREGNSAAAERFPKLDRIHSAEMLPPEQTVVAIPPVTGKGQLM